jgi:predicted nuclease of restriction endonuclease-like RecB superfamily
MQHGRILPSFLDAQDVPWLRVLIDEVDRFRGMPMGELVERLRQPLPCGCPPFKSRAATAVLLRLWKSQPDAAIAPGSVRQALFCAAVEHETTSEAFDAAAKALGVTPETIARVLFTDLPG